MPPVSTPPPAPTPAAEAEESENEFNGVIANESALGNELFGAIQYGVEGNHHFGKVNVDGTFVLIHEGYQPGPVIDEARLGASVAAYAALRDHVAFYPGRVACFLDQERVRPQAGDFYGGWVSDDIAGPFKGATGTLHW